jgi:NADH dehydrogenase [ubiquinone] 1 alpha subcomplex assembly factor 7
MLRRLCTDRCSSFTLLSRLASTHLRRLSSAPIEMSREPLSPLGAELKRQVLFGGAIPASQYMRLCLTHPKFGYYTTTKEVFGPDGDFVTAPEVSQVYGELVAVWIADVVRQLRVAHGERANFALAELGPGRGTLMNDILRVLIRLKCSPTAVHFVETSPVLRNLQQQRLKQYGLKNDISMKWYGALDQVPDVGKTKDSPPVIYIAQEFFDALPVHVVQRVGHGPWRERYVDMIRDDDEEARASPLHFRFVLAQRETLAVSMWKSLLAPAGSSHAPGSSTTDESVGCEGQVVELCADGLALTEEIAGRVSRSGGAALIVDYGFDMDGSLSRSTLRAIRSHQVTSVLSEPGLCDVTADVNFGHLRAVVQRTAGAFHGSMTQRDFLLRLGAAARFRALALGIVDDEALRSADVDAQLLKLQQDYDRLTSPREMGTLYRAAAITHPSISPLAFCVSQDP